jgi:hypothetical protein
MRDKRRIYRLRLDDAARTLELTPRGPAGAGDTPATFTFERPDPGTLTVAGEMAGRRITARLVRRDDDFELTSRGFRWVNEYPHNR